MPHILTEDEEIKMLNELEGLREHIESLKNGITKWKLKVLYDHATSFDKQLRKAYTRNVQLLKQKPC